MIRVFRTVADLEDDAGRRAIRTGLAFLLAPGIAALAGAMRFTLFASDSPTLGQSVVLVLLCVFDAYLTMLALAAPVYLALPRRARGTVVVIPLAGALAALPWLAIPSLGGSGFAFEPTSNAFCLGCVGGVAFVLIRGWTRDTAP